MQYFLLLLLLLINSDNEKLEKDNADIYPDISIEHLLGKINPKEDTLFVAVPRRMCRIRQEYLHKDVFDAYMAMHKAALKEDINLDLISATRTYAHQKKVWQSRWCFKKDPVDVAKEILKYIAMPGSSRHHWGTEIDVMSINHSFYRTPKGKKSFEWMMNNANDFGFYLVYTKDRDIGFDYEPWHWTYLNVARKYQYNYKHKITYSHFKDFYGCEVAEELKIIENYVFGINAELLDF
jgi:zinc D-Ala-D-Ala carboxypeptidase